MTTAAPAAATARRSGRAGAVMRFGATGASAALLYGVVALALGTAYRWPAQVSHLAATAASTVLASSLHRRFTFRATGTASWQQGQTVGAITAVVGLAMSTLTLDVWRHLAPEADRLSGVVLVYAVNALMGVVNFLVLRRALAGPARGGAVRVASLRMR